MLGGIIRAFSSIAYRHPHVPEKRMQKGNFGKLKIALLADYFTAASLAQECSVALLSPNNYKQVIRDWNPDLIFVESAFHGVNDEWRYRLGRQPFYFRLGEDSALKKLIALARDRNIPACFWNKDDSPFFNKFIDVAKLFPYVFTSDSTCLSRYRQKLPPTSIIEVMSIAYQPAFHYFSGFSFEVRGICFVGSYYRKFFAKRRSFLEMMFEGALMQKIPVHIYDRNSHRLSHFFEFRFPESLHLNIHKGVPYEETALLFKKYSISLNVNSVQSSPTMFSRRLLEILACGGICLTNDSLSVKQEFSEFCHIVNTNEEAMETLGRLREGPAASDYEKAAAGAEYVRARHTWERRLEQLANTVKF